MPPSSRALTTRWRAASRRAVSALAGRLGLDVVPRGFYSPIPDVLALPSVAARSPLAGIEFDPDRQLTYLREQLGPFLDGLRIPDHGPPGELHLRNGFYEAADAEVLYATVRARRPARVLELGSGYSTLIIARALRDAGGEGSHTVFDPFASDRLDGVASIVRRSAAELPVEQWTSLGPGDVLFVDTSHTVKPGGEVNHVILDVLPALASGVAVHFHDVFLPWDYPPAYITELRAYWTEEYLLQAFLAMNPGYEPLLALHAIGRLYPEEIARLIPSVRRGAAPCAFWIERR
jgi:predicted O-methyltransferase YrrM